MTQAAGRLLVHFRITVQTAALNKPGAVFIRGQHDQGHAFLRCFAFGKPHKAPRHGFGGGKFQNGEALYEEIASWTREHDKADAMKWLGEREVPCSAVLDTKDLYDDPHLRARGFVKTVEHPELGEVPLLGFAPIMSGSDVPIERAPLLGEHTRQVLVEAGLSAEEIDSLVDGGVVREA